jgi:hypothetical protein
MKMTSSLIILTRYARIDPVAMMSAFAHEDLVLFHVYAMELGLAECTKISERLNRPVTDMVYLFNLEVVMMAW